MRASCADVKRAVNSRGLARASTAPDLCTYASAQCTCSARLLQQRPRAVHPFTDSMHMMPIRLSAAHARRQRRKRLQYVHNALCALRLAAVPMPAYQAESARMQAVAVEGQQRVANATTRSLSARTADAVRTNRARRKRSGAPPIDTASHRDEKLMQDSEVEGCNGMNSLEKAA